jgi:hypothetical protein
MEARNNGIKTGYHKRLKSQAPSHCCILEIHKIFKIKMITVVNIYRRALKLLLSEFGASFVLNSDYCKDI